MKVVVSALLLIAASSFAIDVDHDESTLGVGLFNFLKGEDPKTITPESLKKKTISFLDNNKDIVKRLLTNALNKEIMTPSDWNTWQDVVKGEATDVAIKEGQLEAFTKVFKKTGDETAQQITKKVVAEYFSPIAEALAKDPAVGVKHSLPQQE